MKKIFLSIRFILLTTAVFSIGLFIYQVKETSIIKRRLSDRKSILQEMRSAERKSKKIKRKVIESKQKEKEILRKIPKNKKSIFVLMKELTAIGNSMGIKSISFVIGKSPREDNKALKKNIMRKRRNPHMFNNPESTKSGLITAYHFKMSFAASYMELYDFIKKIISMERVVSLESIEIERNKEYFPRQKVSLKLITYTFSDSKK
ncbi:MAG: hypothetical protein B1H08_01580 [Candidatus Omnitrophica bacterium 4484_171]|nr:MAG: hypothetical protein B1H08_01580 [Candidatus Omnitrophica bacterium 4484_171]